MTFIYVMWVWMGKIIFSTFTSSAAFQLMPAQTNAWCKANLSPGNSCSSERIGWLNPPVSWQPILTPFSYTYACVLALGQRDALASAGAAAGKSNNIPPWTAAVCLPHLPQASYFEHVGTEHSFLTMLCQMLQHPWDGNTGLTCKMMCYL